MSSEIYMRTESVPRGPPRPSNSIRTISHTSTAAVQITLNARFRRRILTASVRYSRSSPVGCRATLRGSFMDLDARRA